MKLKSLTYLLIFFALAGCDSEEGLNCFQAAGDIVREEMTVPPFKKIVLWERMRMVIKQGDEQKVEVETGENLLNDIELSVTDSLLQIRNENGCNLVRDYGITTIYVTSPNITEIRNSSGLEIRSDGVLSYETLTLLSEDRMNEDEYHIDGDFYLNLDVDKLFITANGLSNFFLQGNAGNASIGFYAGDCRLEAGNLTIQNLNFYHRGTSDIIVNPQQSIRGQIVSLGNVICKNRPEIIEVEERYRGRLIFE